MLRPVTRSVTKAPSAGAILGNPELLEPGGWSAVVGAGGSATNSPPGTLSLTGVGVLCAFDQSEPTVIGATYTFTATLAVGPANLRIGGSVGAGGVLNVSPAVGVYTTEFVATSAVSHFRIAKTTGSTVVSAISCKRK